MGIKTNNHENSLNSRCKSRDKIHFKMHIYVNYIIKIIYTKLF